MMLRASMRHRASCCLAPLAFVLMLVGCGGQDPRPGPEVAGGNAGVDERVGAGVKVLDVELEYPLDGLYEAGEDARLYLALSNTGSSADALLEVSGPDFADVRVTGTSAVTRGLPIEIAAEDTVYVGAEGEPAITLIGLDRALRSSESISVTLRYRTAGSVTVQAPVAAAGQTPSPTYDFPDPADDPTGEG